MNRPPMNRRPPVHVPPGARGKAERQREHDRQRGSSAARGYGSRWQRARLRFLSRPENALCRHCEAQGRTTPATDVDHIQRHRGNQALMWDEQNWQPLCHSCHSAKTATEGSGMGIKGADAEGRPLDPSHPWNRDSR